MSHQTGIQVSEELGELFANAVAKGDLRIIRVSIINESLVPNGTREIKSDWKSDFSEIAEFLEEEVPCFILYRLDSKSSSGDYEWLFAAYVPDHSKVRNKMLYAATRATLTKELGNNRFVDSMYGTSMSEFTLEGYEQHKKHQNADAPLTQREKELAEIKIAFPLTDEAIEAIKSLKSDSNKNNFVLLSIDTEKEKVELDVMKKIDIENLANSFPIDMPRYAFFIYDHHHNGQEINSTSNSKRARLRRAQSSTTLQFAPPTWLSKVFQQESSYSQNYYPERSRFPGKIFSRISSTPFLAPKLLFIMLCAGTGASIPFLPIFYKVILELSSTEIGAVFSLAPFIAALSCPLWTGLADKFQAHRFIIVVIYSLATLGVVSQMILPTIVDTKDQAYHGFVLGFVLIAAVWFAFFGIPVNALIDSGVLKILGDKRELYGQQRLWGSIAYGSSTLIVGLLWGAFNNINVVFFYFFTTAALLVLCTMFTDFNPTFNEIEIIPTTHYKDYTFKPLIDLGDHDDADVVIDDYGSSSRNVKVMIDDSTHIDESDGDDSDIDDDDDDGIPVPDLDILAFPPTTPNLPTASLSDHSSSSIKVLLTNPSVVTLLAVMLLMGIALAMSNSFLLLFLSQDLQATSTILGLTGPLSSVTELIFFFYSKELISQFGIYSLVILAHIVTILRCLTYTLLQPNLISHMLALLVQLLNGIGFSALWVSAVTHMANNAPPNLVSFSQGLMTAFYAGIGTGFGSLFGGLLYDSNGGAKLMFEVVVIISCISLFVYIVGENRFNIDITYFGGKRYDTIELPWQDSYHNSNNQSSSDDSGGRLGAVGGSSLKSNNNNFVLIPNDDDDNNHM
ncbi:19736_t:CDS:10 [Entrophospora sp. SA101]|nr:19736_t:CDS:10 [Entrophospora sp. SA101]CAJ0835318.1 4668_t:CDS:10 [Entrophospora sp. SA101]